MVEGILEYLDRGDAIEDILAEFPDLVRDDVLASIAYATASMKLRISKFLPHDTDFRSPFARAPRAIFLRSK